MNREVSGDMFRAGSVFSTELVLVPHRTENLPSEGIWETFGSLPHVGEWHGNKGERARQTGSEDAEICIKNFCDTRPKRSGGGQLRGSRQKGSRQKRHLQGYWSSLPFTSVAGGPAIIFTAPRRPLAAKQQPLVNLGSSFYVADTRCQMAMLHHHEQNTANITGRSINEASLHRSLFLEVVFFFFFCNAVPVSHK